MLPRFSLFQVLILPGFSKFQALILVNYICNLIFTILLHHCRSQEQETQKSEGGPPRGGDFDAAPGMDPDGLIEVSGAT